MVNSVSSVVDPTLPLKGEVKVVDSVSSEVDPTLPSKSQFQVVNLDSSVIDPTLPLKGEVKVVESMSSPPDTSLPIESENHSAKVFVVSSDCSMQEEVLSLSTKPSLSSEVISFDWSNLTKGLLLAFYPLLLGKP